MTRPAIAIVEEGPYLIVGPIEVVGEKGERKTISRKVTALCACGSPNDPSCDGPHATLEAQTQPQS